MRNPYEKLIVDELKKYMKAEEITQIELARRLGWSTSDMSDILNGKKPIGKIRQQCIANRLGISFDLSDLRKKIVIIKSPQPKDVNDTILNVLQILQKIAVEEQEFFLKWLRDYLLLKKKLYKKEGV